MTDPIRIEGVSLPPDGHAVRVSAAGSPVAIFRHDGRLYAIDATCTHAHGPLDQGPVTGTTVECPWHGSQFSIETGEVRRGPAPHPVGAYSVAVEGTTVLLTRKT